MKTVMFVTSQNNIVVHVSQLYYFIMHFK